MSKELQDNIKVQAGKHIDDRYLNGVTPYVDVAEVNSIIVLSRRYLGLPVLIVDQEYWYLNGIADGDLVLKTVSAQNHWRGGYDLSVNAYPSSGGTGPSGVPAPGNKWYVTVAGDVDVTGVGVITLNPDATLEYKGGDPTLAASWIVKQ